jgi:hypothetical protein
MVKSGKNRSSTSVLIGYLVPIGTVKSYGLHSSLGFGHSIYISAIFVSVIVLVPRW